MEGGKKQEMKKILVGMVCLLILTLIVGLVMAQESQQQTTATVVVEGFLSATFTNIPVTFQSGMVPGETQNATVGGGYPLTVTIGSETNVGSIYVKTEADTADFCTDYPACLGDTMPISSMEWTNNISGTPVWVDYLISPGAEVCSGLDATGICNIYHRLIVPDAQEAGTYSTEITITATTPTP